MPLVYQKDLPQQEPGPAQPAWPGWLPQQPVSFGPGKSAPVRPVSELVADMILAVSVEPQLGQVNGASLAVTITSPVLPQAWLLTGEAKYLAGAVRACQFGAGANPDNRAYTTGLGPDPVRFPLHVDSGVSGQPAPAGITVYGGSDPVEDFGDAWVHTWYLQKMQIKSKQRSIQPIPEVDLILQINMRFIPAKL